MSKHNETILLGRFKPRFFIIIGIVLIGIILVYLYGIGIFRDWQIQLSYYNSTIIGDGQSTMSIPFTILKGTEQPITVPIQVQAITNIGSVTTTCSAPSVCSAILTAPSTSKTEYANVSINVGGTSSGVTKTVQIEVLPDPTSSVSAHISITNLPYFPNPPVLYLSYGNVIYVATGYGRYYQISNINVTATALDKNGYLVPNGTLIRFNVGRGNLSKSSCITNDGSCMVTYTPTLLLGNTTINEVSYNATASENLITVRPPIANYTYNIQNDTLEEVAHSQACGFEYCASYNYSLTGTATFGVTVKDVLNEPISGVTIYGKPTYPYPPYGTSSECITNTQGECNLVYSVNSSYIYDNSTSAYWAAQGGTTLYTPSLAYTIFVNDSSYPITLDCTSGLACNYT